MEEVCIRAECVGTTAERTVLTTIAAASCCRRRDYIKELAVRAGYISTSIGTAAFTAIAS